jgi:hypothetical protein
MTRILARLALSATLGLSLLAPAAAQRDKDADTYRKLFKKPETVPEFWTALRFEIDIGKYELAAAYLHQLLLRKPGDEDLVRLQETEGLTPLLNLRKVRVWSRNPKIDEQAHQDVEELIRQVTAAVRRKFSDADRIRRNIRALSAIPEERDYALRELYRSGAAAVPYLVDALRAASEPAEKVNLLYALRRLGPETLPPLLACLDSNDTALKLEVLDILRKRHLRRREAIIPQLWHLAASKSQPAEVRKKAQALLADLEEVPADRLTPAKVALTRQAERYYKHRQPFPDKAKVIVWRWDEKEKHPVAGWPGVPTLTATQAEEYWGAYYARQALDLDPSYRPAQVAMLCLALDKAMEKAGPAQPLSRAAPAVHGLVAKSSTDLLLDALERAMKEKRTPVVLAMVRALGERAEARARQPRGKGEPALVRALYYPDRRVQFAAAEALLAIPGDANPRTAARVVEVLARALTTETAERGRRRVLVAVANETWRDQVRDVVTRSRFDAVPAADSRQALRILRAGDVDAVLLDSTMPPGAAPVLAQLRADVDAAPIPVLLAAVPESRTARDLLAREVKARARLRAIRERTRSYQLMMRELADDLTAKVKKVEANKVMSSEEKVKAIHDLEAASEKDAQGIDKRYPEDVLLYKDIGRIEDELAKIAAAYDREARVREDQLARFAERYPNVTVVNAGLFTDVEGLEPRVRFAVGEAGAALSPPEQRDHAERAIRAMARLAVGTPAGYDIRPAAGAILAALRSDKFSQEGQLAAVVAASRLSGARPQSELAGVVREAARPGPVRVAAAAGLIRSIQRHGLAMKAAEAAPLRELARDPKLDADLKAQLAALVGVLRADDRRTGERLRDYRPGPPVKVAPPPKD